MAQSDIILYSMPNIYGRRFKCSKRTGAHLDRTRKRLRDKGRSLRIIQGSYNDSVAASAGTHDYDAVFDVEITGMSWPEAQHWLRENGWAAWVRTPAQGFTYHIHMVSLPRYKLKWVSKVGEYVPGQVVDYYNHEDGLAGGGHDPSWFPPNIRATIFNYTAWVAAEALRRQRDRVKKKIAEWQKELRKIRDRIRNGRT